MIRIAIVGIFSIMLLACSIELRDKSTIQTNGNDHNGYDTAPELKYRPEIDYPSEALENGYGAEVWILVHIDSTGTPTEAEVKKIKGRKNIGFEAEAIRNAMSSKWIPPTIDGKFIDTCVTYKLVFDLR